MFWIDFFVFMNLFEVVCVFVDNIKFVVGVNLEGIGFDVVGLENIVEFVFK